MTDLKQAAQAVVDRWDSLSWSWSEKTPTANLIAALRTALEQEQAEPVSMRMPKVGDKVICLEDESFGEVVSLTGGGSPDITFDDGSRGTYLLREFAELFGYVAPPQQQAEFDCPRCGHVCSQRPWVGLTEDEVLDVFKDRNVMAFSRAIEDKLKEKNDQ